MLRKHAGIVFALIAALGAILARKISAETALLQCADVRSLDAGSASSRAPTTIARHCAKHVQFSARARALFAKNVFLPAAVMHARRRSFAVLGAQRMLISRLSAMAGECSALAARMTTVPFA